MYWEFQHFPTICKKTAKGESRLCWVHWSTRTASGVHPPLHDQGALGPASEACHLWADWPGYLDRVECHWSVQPCAQGYARPSEKEKDLCLVLYILIIRNLNLKETTLDFQEYKDFNEECGEWGLPTKRVNIFLHFWKILCMT